MSTAVNKVSNNDASLLEPLPADGERRRRRAADDRDPAQGPVQDTLL